MTNTLLSVIVVLYNSEAELACCLDSLQEVARSGWAEVILVDNASPDQSVELCRRVLPEARLISLDVNRGFAGGVNAALEQAVGRYVLLLNPDVTVPAGGLSELVAWMDLNPRLAAASPDIVRPDGRSESPARRFPTIWRTALESSRLHRVLPQRLCARALMGSYGTGGHDLDVDWVPGTAMIVRANVINDIGGLNETLFMYGEDIEWCSRMRRAGHRVGVNTRLAFLHRTSSSSLRSWGDLERDRRVTAGIAAACQLMYGPVHSRLLAAVIGVSLMLEARLGRQGKDSREALAAGSRVWFESALRG